MCVRAQSLQLYPTLATPWTVARCTPLSMGFFRQEYWIGLPFSPPRDLPNLEIKPMSPALQVDSLLLSHQGSPTKRVMIKFTEIETSRILPFFSYLKDEFG